ncbi:MAG: hypothetical protein AB8E15_04795 [Bdellovibrionales bacterium]
MFFRGLFYIILFCTVAQGGTVQTYSSSIEYLDKVNCDYIFEHLKFHKKAYSELVKSENRLAKFFSNWQDSNFKSKRRERKYLKASDVWMEKYLFWHFSADVDYYNRSQWLKVVWKDTQTLDLESLTYELPDFKPVLAGGLTALPDLQIHQSQSQVVLKMRVSPLAQCLKRPLRFFKEGVLFEAY